MTEREERRRQYLREECNKPGFKLPFGVVYAYIVVDKNDKKFTALAMSFDSEELIAMAANERESYMHGWGLEPRVMRISVIRIEGAWHKINIRPIKPNIIFPDGGSVSMTAMNFAPNLQQAERTGKTASLLKPPLQTNSGEIGEGVMHEEAPKQAG
jgi:hypothetical protein